MDFPQNPPHKPGYTLEFEDTFTSGAIDTDKWVPHYLPHWSSRARTAPRHGRDADGFALRIDSDQPPWCPEFNGEVKCSSIQTGVYAGAVGSPDGQHRFRPGLLVREAQPTVRTYTPLYGYFEIRLQAIRAADAVVALWMIGFEDAPEQSGEIAIVEVFGGQMTDASAEVRYGVHPWGDASLTDDFYRDTLAIDATAWHVYAAEWTPTHIDFYIDNVKRRTIAQSPTYPMQFMLGVYEVPGLTSADPVAQANASLYPKRFAIDYFRGYRPVGGY